MTLLGSGLVCEPLFYKVKPSVCVPTLLHTERTARFMCVAGSLRVCYFSIVCEVFPHRQGAWQRQLWLSPNRQATGHGEICLHGLSAVASPLARCLAGHLRSATTRTHVHLQTQPHGQQDGVGRPCAQRPPTVGAAEPSKNHECRLCLPGTIFLRISRTVSTSVISCDLSNLYWGSGRSPPRWWSWHL